MRWNGAKILVFNIIAMIIFLIIMTSLFVYFTFSNKEDTSLVSTLQQLYSDGLQYSNALRMTYIDANDTIAQKNIETSCENIIKNMKILEKNQEIYKELIGTYMPLRNNCMQAITTKKDTITTLNDVKDATEAWRNFKDRLNTLIAKYRHL